MQTQVVGDEKEGYVLIISENQESQMSYNFEGTKLELTRLYRQIKDKLEIP